MEITYTLTEAEYKALKMEGVTRTQKQTEILQDLCTKVADHMPITIDDWPNWGTRPWGCLITIEKEGDEHYCDHCPVEDVCPYPNKDWSQ